MKNCDSMCGLVLWRKTNRSCRENGRGKPRQSHRRYSLHGRALLDMELTRPGIRAMTSKNDGGGARLRLFVCPSGEAIAIPGDSILVGRHSDADLRLPLPDVSRRHCRFVCKQGHWRVIDLSSTNGTFVNEHKIDEADLKPGDHIRVSGVEFELAPDAALRQAS
jgi:hypothetical protein